MDQEYTTTSISLAAALTLEKFPCLRLDWTEDNNRAIFVFEDSEALRVIAGKFWAKELQRDCLTYFEALRMLKSRLYEFKNQ